MNTIYFSLDLTNRKASKQDVRNVMQRLNSAGIKNILVIGSYKGEKETSISAKVSNASDFNLVKSICETFNQESFLVVDVNGRSMLHFVSSNVVEPLGTFVKVSRAEAQTLQAWTYVPHTDEFFTCVSA